MSDQDLGDRVTREANRRLKSPTNSSTAGTAAADAAAAGATGKVDDDSEVLFDVVAIQFALHYACSDEARLLRTLNLCASSLKEGGVVLATIIDSRALVEGLARATTDATTSTAVSSSSNSSSSSLTSSSSSETHVEFGNGVFKVQALAAQAQALASAHTKEEEEEKEKHGAKCCSWGIEYLFSLGDAVQVSGSGDFSKPRRIRMTTMVMMMMMITKLTLSPPLPPSLPFSFLSSFYLGVSRVRGAIACPGVPGGFCWVGSGACARGRWVRARLLARFR
jgi:hypothetical protein